MLVPAIIAFIAAWTDFFDGRLARKWDVSSKTGAFLDTIADKIFIKLLYLLVLLILKELVFGLQFY